MALRPELAPRRWLTVFGMAVLGFGTGLSGEARAQSMVPTLVFDAGTGEVISSESATRPWFPASTTKLMTAYVALRAIRSGEIRPDTPIIVSPNASRQPPSKIGLKPGQEITLDAALKILMVKSANDIATIVAEGVSGSVPAFAAQMNREAARLGMRESRFVNPHGLHADQQVTSARDMGLLARALLVEFPEYHDLWSIGAVKLGNRVFNNTNGLIGRYDGAIGMKTGFICASGFNLVSAATRNGRTLVAVVFGASTGADRTLKAAQLLEQGFGNSGGFFGTRSTGRTLGALTASLETSAPNRRADICRKGAPPASESEDAGGAIAFSAMNSDRPSDLVRFMQAPQPTTGIGQRIGDTISLGPRTNFEPMLVSIGRKEGSLEAPRRPTGMAVLSEKPARKAKTPPKAKTPVKAKPSAKAKAGQPAKAAPKPPPKAKIAPGTNPAAKAKPEQKRVPAPPARQG